MDTTEQEPPRPKFMTSEIVSHQLRVVTKKTRSNSVDGDLEHDEK